MEGKGKQLMRLAAVYAAVERIRAVELSHCNREAAEAEDALRIQSSLMDAAWSQSRSAVAQGNRLDGLLAEIQRFVAGAQSARLVPVIASRRVMRDAEQARFLESRMEREQIGSLVDAFQSAQDSARGRRIQMESDDRFLSRQRWMEKRSG